MTIFDAKKALHTKKFHRFTGPPENWLTAIKYMTWGLEEKYLDRWGQISVGDVFLMHSTANSDYVKKPLSSVLGLGVVGGNFRKKDDFLWIQEVKTQKNIWPLLIPFSEIYLFSELPPVGSWLPPGMGSDEKIPELIMQLLKNAVPISSFSETSKFPVMGSFSTVKNEVADQLFSKAEPVLYTEFYDENSFSQASQASGFLPTKDAGEAMRSVPTLKFLDGKGVKVRKQTASTSSFERDNALLERAEQSHQDILQAAIDFFRKKGFDTWSNQHVDLLAESEDKSFLIEVKSTVNQNFRTQARRAVGQLFEYEYFDVRSYFEKKSKNTRLSKVLMVTDDPTDVNYSSFLNTLKVHLAWPAGTHLKVRGEAGELASLIQNN